MSYTYHEPLFIMMNIYVYTGKGAYQAKDVEMFLAVFGYEYLRINEHELDQIKNPGVLIIPGGEVGSYLSAWKEKGVKAINEFVRQGGIYIGICSGVYVAGNSYDGTPGLNFFSSQLKYKKHQSVVRVTDSENNKYQLIAENGPALDGINNKEVLLKDATGSVQAIKLRVNKGWAFFFSSHPEGSVYYNKYPQTFSGAKYLNQLLKGF